MRTPARDRSGFALAELAVAAVLLGLVAGAAFGTIASARRIADGVAATSEMLEAGRVVRHVLEVELRGGHPPRDRTLGEDGALRIRAFRGWGVPCAPVDPLTGRVQVLREGHRSPSPAKDSVLVLDGDGRWRVARLAGKSRLPTGVSCSPEAGAVAEEWTLQPSVPRARLLRFFESGSYEIRSRAFRYRRGRGGRQPLTPEVVNDRRSGWAEAVGGALDVRLRLRSGALPEATDTLRWTLWPGEPAR